MGAIDEIHILGSGSFALEIAEYAAAAGLRVAGLIEARDPARVGTIVHGLAVRGGRRPAPGACAVIGVYGDRRALWEPLAASGWRAVAVAHPAAHVSPSARLGEGCIVGPGAVVGAAASLGPHALVARGALVGHHTRLGAGAVLNPGANIGGNSTIGAGASVGMGATVVNGIRVGEKAVIGAGAVVVRDVAAGTRVQGVPARLFEEGA
jgi:acetyltransferase EpsM